MNIDPEHIGARNNLGFAPRTIGRIEQAIDLFKKTIAASPRTAARLYYNLASSKRIAASDPDFAAMKRLAKDVGAFELEDQIGLHFALGKAYADVGDHARAFKELAKGNTLKRRQHLALPNARIIHTRRDPRDTALSCFSILFALGHAYTYDLGELGRYIAAYQRLMEHWRQVLPDGAMLEVQYEELMGDLETEARRIVEFCGLGWDAACLSFYKTERPVRTASVIQVRQPIYPSSVGRWRAYEKELQPLLIALAQA